MLYTIHGIAQNDSYVSIRKVVIDAGHGGKDPGAVSINRKTQEKNITLTVALKLGDLIKKNFPDIKVIYTRSTDVFIPLNQRTDIANKNRADLFISVHVNSAKARSAAGTETFVMGMDKSSSNLEVSKLENSVVVLEGDDFSSKYEGFDPNVPESYIIFSLLQNSHLEHSLSFASLVQRNLSKGPIIINRGIKQAGLLVLWRTTMPSVLVELGFISNNSDLGILVQEENQDRFAGAIFDAFTEYKDIYEKGNSQFSMIASKEHNDSNVIPIDTGKKVIQDKDTTPKKTVVQKALASKSMFQNTDVQKTDVQKTDVQKTENKKQFYAIQILAVTKILSPGSSDLKGFRDAGYSKMGNFYKYYTGMYNTPEDASAELKFVKKNFPQAFIIKVEDGIIVPMNK
ncbi:MAG: N-acetylmuramoyl-L-alanine amidase [Bacteroidales bacterium]|nr:N-acetylmuramoyl-L-alanine amidase [Bacteroidales bacterium]